MKTRDKAAGRQSGRGHDGLLVGAIRRRALVPTEVGGSTRVAGGCLDGGRGDDGTGKGSEVFGGGGLAITSRRFPPKTPDPVLVGNRSRGAAIARRQLARV